MNSELILKLSREAEFLAREHVRDCEIYGYTMFEGNAEDEFHAEFRYRFAELIVRECAEVAGEIAFQQWCDNGENESARSAILEHFGVK